MKTKEKSDEGFGPSLAQLPVREQARQVLRRIQESNVRLSFGPGMHVMTPDKFVFDAVLEALAAAEARALAAEARAERAEAALREAILQIEYLDPHRRGTTEAVLVRSRAALTPTGGENE